MVDIQAYSTIAENKYFAMLNRRRFMFGIKIYWCKLSQLDDNLETWQIKVILENRIRFFIRENWEKTV